MFTDGQCDNMNEVLDLCRCLPLSTRIVAFGLGLSPNRSLFKSLSQITHGQYVYLQSNKNMNDDLYKQLENIRRQIITNIRIEWNFNVDVLTVPDKIRTSYVNDRFIVYALANNDELPFTCHSSMSIRTDQSFEHVSMVNVEYSSNSHPIIARLAARALIKTFEQQLNNININEQANSWQTIHQSIIRLSFRYRIPSLYTTFIGIERSHTCQQHDRIERSIPIDIPSSYQQWRPTSLHVRMIRSIDSSLDRIGHDEMIVRRMIDRQTSAGHWTWQSSQTLINEHVRDIHGRLPTSFVEYMTNEIIPTVTVVVIFETKFPHKRCLWELAADRARQHLIYAFNNNWRTFVSVFNEIRTIVEQETFSTI
jgi:hypothetical protein